ncbi:MAG TPA: DUF2917 domain-containing protein [Polyangia bacterium]|jgi:hypothetical protein|nr:DUF2917 domain-containing protein [Polyangia bacterium]
MRIDGIAATVSLERERSLRVARGAEVQVTCASGVLWVTCEGDLRDVILTAGQSFTIKHRGVTLVTALKAATVWVRDGRAGDGAPSVARIEA